MNAVSLDYQKAKNFFSQEELDNMSGMVKACHEMLHAKSGAGNDFLGWLDLPENYDRQNLTASKKRRTKSRATPMYSSLLVSAVRTSAQEP